MTNAKQQLADALIELVDAAVDRAMRNRFGEGDTPETATIATSTPPVKMSDDDAEKHRQEMIEETRELAKSAMNKGLAKDKIVTIIKDAGGDNLSGLDCKGLVSVAGALEAFIDKN